MHNLYGSMGKQTKRYAVKWIRINAYSSFTKNVKSLPFYLIFAKITYYASMSMKDAEDKPTFSALKQVFAQLPVTVFVFDPRGHLLSANKTLGTLMGYAEEELFHVAP